MIHKGFAHCRPPVTSNVALWLAVPEDLLCDAESRDLKFRSGSA